jgi:hypothetical protein
MWVSCNRKTLFMLSAAGCQADWLTLEKFSHIVHSNMMSSRQGRKAQRRKGERREGGREVGRAIDSGSRGGQPLLLTRTHTPTKLDKMA